MRKSSLWIAVFAIAIFLLGCGASIAAPPINADHSSLVASTANPENTASSEEAQGIKNDQQDYAGRCTAAQFEFATTTTTMNFDPAITKATTIEGTAIGTKNTDAARMEGATPAPIVSEQSIISTEAQFSAAAIHGPPITNTLNSATKAILEDPLTAQTISAVRNRNGSNSVAATPNTNTSYRQTRHNLNC